MAGKRQSFAADIREGKLGQQLQAIREKLLDEMAAASGRDLVAIGKELIMIDGALPVDPDRTRSDMQALRDRAADQIENADDLVIPGRDVAALTRVLRESIVILDRIPQHGEKSNVVDIAERVRTKRAATSHRDRAGSVRDVRAGGGRARRERRADRG